MKILKITLCLAIALALASCSKKKDDSTPVAPNVVKPTIFTNAKAVTVPTKLETSTDTYAKMCNSYVDMANNLSAYSAYFNVPAGATEVSTKSSSTSSIKTYTYSYGTWIIYYVLEETSDKYIWTIYYTYAAEGITKGKYLSAEQSKDGKIGSLIWYNPSENVEVGRYVWQTLVDGTFNFKVIYAGLLIELNVKSDKSGTLDYTYNEALLYHFQWAIDGSGSWILYSGGVEYQSGTWTAK